MARDLDNNNKGNSVPYIIAAILLAVIMIINFILINYYYNTNTLITASISRMQGGTSTILSQLNEINLKTLQMVSGSDDNESIIEDITNYNYNTIKGTEGMITHFNELPEEAVARYNRATDLIDIYFAKLQPLSRKWDKDPTSTQSSMSLEYNRELYPYYVSASEMLKASSTIIGAHAAKMRARGTRMFYIVNAVMAAMLVLAEIAIFIAAKLAKKSRQVIADREKNLAEVDAKLKNTRQKASDLAITNILTGMKNRYALDGDISERLETDRFNIAVFDLDNFRSINDTYGYDFGDEYLAAVAEQLKEQFSNFAEIYNITGNEFCFLFNRDISENQAMAHAQKIQAVMSSPYNIMNLTVQLTCSGALYHYLPGDCLNVNSLLVKLDTAMRSVKMNGGNMITSVMNI
ncbi:MAG: GGDEF domain-containing protein [Ruminococcus sp.]|nr:GGDEF domain-containing protein [Ruminococcus sp.]